MVCVPCFIIPVLLFVWRLLQPYFLKYIWNPWQKKDAQGNVIKAAPEFPFKCVGDTCPFPIGNKNKDVKANESSDTAVADDKKKD